MYTTSWYDTNERAGIDMERPEGWTGGEHDTPSRELLTIVVGAAATCIVSHRADIIDALAASAQPHLPRCEPCKVRESRLVGYAVREIAAAAAAEPLNPTTNPIKVLNAWTLDHNGPNAGLTGPELMRKAARRLVTNT